MSKLPIICIDFDGVLHSYTSPWRGPGEVSDGPVPGAATFLARAVAVATVAVYSSRSESPEGVRAMERALRAWLGTELGEEEGGRVLGLLTWPTSKPPALVTLDDRAVTFRGEWPDPAELVLFRPWNRLSPRTQLDSDRRALARQTLEPVEVASSTTTFPGTLAVDPETGVVRYQRGAPVGALARGDVVRVELPDAEPRLARVIRVLYVGAGTVGVEARLPGARP